MLRSSGLHCLQTVSWRTAELKPCFAVLQTLEQYCEDHPDSTFARDMAMNKDDIRNVTRRTLPNLWELHADPVRPPSTPFYASHWSTQLPISCGTRQWPYSCADRMQATSVRLFAEREAAGNTGRVFCHQAQDRPAGRGFLLGLTSPFMLSQATLHGHGGAVLVDATHAMNSYNVRL
jgi:hypothetical protein